MITATAAAFLLGTGIGLHASVRACVAAILIMVSACIACVAFGWISPIGAALDSFAITVALVMGYGALSVVRDMYVDDARAMVAAHHVINSPSASGNPSRR